MWDSCRLLNIASNILFSIVAAAVLYAFVRNYGLQQVLPLKEIHVQSMHSTQTGFKRITREQIEKIARYGIHGNFLSVDLRAVRDVFIEIPWVRDAKVERAWPQGLIVKLEEHEALAHWGSHALVNTHGEVFRVVLDENLPIFTAPRESNSQEVTQRYQQFSSVLAPLRQSIKEITLSSRHAWRIRLEIGTTLELGRNEIEKRLERYASVYNQSIAHLNQAAPLAYVDLRYPNGFAVRMPEDAKQSLKGKNNVRTET